MRYILIIISLIMLVSCSHKVTMTRGQSYGTAIKINELTSREGIRAEYQYIRTQNPGGFVIKSQTLAFKDKKPYDIITIQTLKDNREVQYYFDVSSFYGKLV